MGVPHMCGPGGQGLGLRLSGPVGNSMHSDWNSKEYVESGGGSTSASLRSPAFSGLSLLISCLPLVTSALCRFPGPGPALALEWREKADRPLSQRQGLPVQVNEMHLL